MTANATPLDQIRAHADPDRARDMAAYHKADRPCLGVSNVVLNELTRDWRRSMPVSERIEAADILWRSNIHEARIAAAKLLTQARIRPDGDVWALLHGWVPEFDGWAIADHASKAIERRLVAVPERLDTVESWTRSTHMWTRRAALVSTLHWAKITHPKPEDTSRRERILGWAGGYVHDRDWFIQKCVAWWLRDLSKHDPDRTRAFLERHGNEMKAFARREAGKYLRDTA